LTGKTNNHSTLYRVIAYRVSVPDQISVSACGTGMFYKGNVE